MSTPSLSDMGEQVTFLKEAAVILSTLTQHYTGQHEDDFEVCNVLACAQAVQLNSWPALKPEQDLQDRERSDDLIQTIKDAILAVKRIFILIDTLEAHSKLHHMGDRK